MHQLVQISGHSYDSKLSKANMRKTLCYFFCFCKFSFLCSVPRGELDLISLGRNLRQTFPFQEKKQKTKLTPTWHVLKYVINWGEIKTQQWKPGEKGGDTDGQGSIAIFALLWKWLQVAHNLTLLVHQFAEGKGSKENPNLIGMDPSPPIEM